jgi:hypothetical protein
MRISIGRMLWWNEVRPQDLSLKITKLKHKTAGIHSHVVTHHVMKLPACGLNAVNSRVAAVESPPRIHREDCLFHVICHDLKLCFQLHALQPTLEHKSRSLNLVYDLNLLLQLIPRYLQETNGNRSRDSCQNSTRHPKRHCQYHDQPLVLHNMSNQPRQLTKNLRLCPPTTHYDSTTTDYQISPICTSQTYSHNWKSSPPLPQQTASLWVPEESKETPENQTWPPCVFQYV